MEERPLSSRFFVLLSLPATAMGFALCVQISTLSWILTTQLKLTTTQVGLVWSAGPLAGIIGQVLIGVASDKVWFWGGRRRPFILIGGLMAALMLLALPHIKAISDTLGIGLIPVAVMVALTLDLAINVGFNPTRSIIADLTPEGPLRTQGFTWMQSISGSFGVLAYSIGVQWGNFVLIYVGMILVFLFTAIPPLLLKEPRELHVEPPAVEGGPELPVRSSEAFELGKIYLAHAFSWLGIQSMFVYNVAFLKGQFGATLNDDAIGKANNMAFLVLNLMGFLVPALMLEPMSRVLGRVRTHSLCLLVMAGGYLAIGTACTSPTMLCVFMGVVGIGWGAVLSLPFAIFSEKVGRNKMGTYMGIFNLSVVLPQLISSNGLGAIFDHAPNKSLIYLVCGGSLAASAVLWLLVKDRPGGVALPAASGGHH